MAKSDHTTVDVPILCLDHIDKLAVSTRLFKLVKAGEVVSAEKKSEKDAQAIVTPGFVDYELSEENVLVLDMAEFKVEGEEEFSPVEEVLRLDNICRERLGLEERGGAVVQPWVYGAQPHVSKVTLRYKFNSVCLFRFKVSFENFFFK